MELPVRDEQEGRGRPEDRRVPHRKFYAYNEKDPKSYAKVVDKTRMDLILEIDGQEGKFPRFQWKDGSESTILEDEFGRKRALDSSKEVVA